MDNIYGSPRWRTARARALKRDADRCTVARLLGGQCSPSLHVHHIIPARDGGDPFALDNLATVCSAHHPVWEALRRLVVKKMLAGEPRCPHTHRTAEARRICEQRLSAKAA